MNQPLCRRFFAALSAAVLLSVLFLSGVFDAENSAETDDDVTYEEVMSQIADAKSELAALAKKQDAVSEKLAAAKKDKTQSLSEKMLLEEKIELLEEEYEYCTSYIKGLDSSIESLEAQIDDTQTSYDEYYETYKSRIRANYENGAVSYLEIFLTSHTFSELLTRIDYAAYMISYDKTLLANLESALGSIKSDKYELELCRAESLAAKADLEVTLEEKNTAVSDLNDRISSLEEDVDSLYAQTQMYNEMEAELDAQMSELLNLKKKFMDGYLIWPLYNYSTISSKFGWRTLYGKADYHTGIDIPAPAGVDIHAAASGTVIMARWVTTGGGLKIMIDHGDGISTIYCHCSKILVSEGDEVKQGDVIGRVGTTGNSTGNHLHFGIYKNKEYLNPTDYINFDNDTSKMKDLFS